MREQFLVRAHLAQLALCMTRIVSAFGLLTAGARSARWCVLRPCARGPTVCAAPCRCRRSTWPRRGSKCADCRPGAGKVDQLLLACGKRVAASRTGSSKPLGSESTKSSTFTSRAARRIAASEISSLPRRIFSPMVPEKRNGSCKTTAKCGAVHQIVFAQVDTVQQMRPAVTS